MHISERDQSPRNIYKNMEVKKQNDPIYGLAKIGTDMI